MDYEKKADELIQGGKIGIAGGITMSRVESILKTAKVSEFKFGKSYLILMDRNRVSYEEMNAFGRGLSQKGVRFVLGRIDSLALDSVEVFELEKSPAESPANGETKA